MHSAIPSNAVIASLLLVISLTSGTIHAFSTSPTFSLNQHKIALISLNLFFDSVEYHDEDEDHFDLEEARERFEALLVGDDDTQPKMQTVERPTIRSPSYTQDQLPPLDVVLPPAPPLTTIERERREVEIQLLLRLLDGDEAVSDIWTLWFGERGSSAAQKLVRADELTNRGPASWQHAEDILQGLITEHGVYWVEPVNRLATLYYMQGRLEEAETLCQCVLAVKPWHFGALSGIVMIYAAQADSEKARLWASSRLPTFAPTGANRRRIAWTEKAVESAKESLENAEARIKDIFGKPDGYTAKLQDNSWEEDAWQ